MHINFTRKNDDEVKNMNNYHQEIIRNLKHLKSFFSITNPLCNWGKKKSWNRKKGVIIRDCLFLDWCVKFKNRGWGGRIVGQKTWHIGYNSTHWRKQLWCQEKKFLSNTSLSTCRKKWHEFLLFSINFILNLFHFEFKNVHWKSIVYLSAFRLNFSVLLH